MENNIVPADFENGLKIGKRARMSLSKSDKEFVAAKKKASAIAGIVAGYFILTKSELFGKYRGEYVVRPRQIAQFLIAKHSGFNLSDTARLFKVHHGAVQHSIKEVEESLAANSLDMTKDIAELEKLIHEYNHNTPA